MNVVIVGTGYVGLVTGVCLASKGHRVTCLDADTAKVAALTRAEVPFHEPGVPELLTRTTAAGTFEARGTTDARTAIAAADLVMIAVGTPTGPDGTDFSAIEAASTMIGEALAGGTRHVTVVVKSTVPPGTTDTRVRPIVEARSGRAAGTFSVAMNPEFLREGEAVADFLQADRIVIGAADAAGEAALRELYAFCDAPVVVTTPATAELIKYASNALFATMISLANEVSQVAARFEGVDVRDVMAGVHLDRRITSRAGGQAVTAGAAAYLTAGCGFGGSCFPKDVASLVHVGKSRGVPMSLLDAVLDVNARQRGELFRLTTEALGGVRGTRVAVLGLAFKPDTDDVRESPALPLVRALAEAGADVRAHDPAGMANARALLSSIPVRFAGSAHEALDGADAAVLVTAWPEYAGLAPAVFLSAMRAPVVVDGRRVFDRDAMTAAGVSYWAIGWTPPHASAAPVSPTL